MPNESVFYMAGIFTISREKQIVLMHKACKSPKGSAISSVFCNLHGRKNRPKKLTKKNNRYKYRIGKISVRSGPRSPLPKVTMSKRQLISSEEDTDEGKVAKIGDTDHDENTAHNNMAVATPAKTGKRTDYLSWDEYFMAVAFLSAQRSKDPNSQVGACVVNPERKIVGIGYNGMPNGCSDDELPWARQAESNLETKYPYGERTSNSNTLHAHKGRTKRKVNLLTLRND